MSDDKQPRSERVSRVPSHLTGEVLALATLIDQAANDILDALDALPERIADAIYDLDAKEDADGE